MYGYLTCGAPTKHGGSNWRSIPWVPWAEARLESIILVCTPAGPPSRLVYVTVSIKVEACGVPYYYVRQHRAHVRTNPSHVHPSERHTVSVSPAVGREMAPEILSSLQEWVLVAEKWQIQLLQGDPQKDWVRHIKSHLITHAQQ